MRKWAGCSVMGLLALSALVTAGCEALTGSGGRPYWVDHEGPKNKDPKTIYAMGSAPKDMSEAMQVSMARNAAVKGLAAAVNTYVAGLVKDFMQSHKDFNDPNSASSIAFYQAVNKSVVEACITEAQQTQGWRDPESGTLYVLYEMPKSTIHRWIQMKAAAAARQKETAAFGAKTDQALDALKEELKKKDEAQN